MAYKNPLPIDLRVAAAIRFWRHRNGQAQKQVADRIGCFRTALTKWERGYTSIRLQNFLDIAEALDISSYMLALTAEALDG